MISQPNFQPGDFLGFSERSLRGIIVNLATWGIPFVGLSHVGIIGQHPDTGAVILREVARRVRAWIETK